MKLVGDPLWTWSGGTTVPVRMTQHSWNSNKPNTERAAQKRTPSKSWITLDPTKQSPKWKATVQEPAQLSPGNPRSLPSQPEVTQFSNYNCVQQADRPQADLLTPWTEKEHHNFLWQHQRLFAWGEGTGQSRKRWQRVSPPGWQLVTGRDCSPWTGWTQKRHFWKFKCC